MPPPPPPRPSGSPIRLPPPRPALAEECVTRAEADEAPLSPEIEEQLARLKPEEAGETIGPYNCKEIAFAPAAPETVRTGTGVGE